MTRTRAPQAIPALIVGLLALVFGLSLLGALLGVGAAMLGGVAIADARSHGYTGQPIAIAGMVLGAAAIVMFILSAAL